MIDNQSMNNLKKCMHVSNNYLLANIILYYLLLCICLDPVGLTHGIRITDVVV